MDKKAEKIDLYKNKIKIINSRNATQEEIDNKIKNGTFHGIMDTYINETIKEISDSSELATKILKDSIDVENEINEMLEKDKSYKTAMSPKTPEAILKYQKTNNKNSEKINKEIHEFGVVLTKGQELFHGGLPATKEGDLIISEDVFSTSLNPYVARQNAFHNSKAYNDNELNLNCIKILDDNIRAFVFNSKTKHANEKEILLEKDIEIEVVKKTKVGEMPATNVKSEIKIIPMYVTEIEIRKLKQK